LKARRLSHTPRRKSGSEPSSALNQVNNQDDDRNYEQEMDQTAANVAEKAKKPEHDQDNNYSPEHWYSFRLSKTSVDVFIQRFTYSPSFSEYLASLQSNSAICSTSPTTLRLQHRNEYH
jgi:hypothetical protein